jgi:hypothetical protein
MQKMKTTITGLLALAIFAGCSNDENLPGGNDSDGRVAIRVSSNIDVTDGVKKTSTRAADDKWNADDEIGIFMLNGTSVDEYRNIPYITTSGNGSFAPLADGTVIYLPVDGSGRDFVAYYPHKDAATDGNYTIDLTEQDDQSAIDFMTSEKANVEHSKVQGISKSDPDVKFRFSHRLAKLRLNIETGAGFKGDHSELAGLTVELTGQQTTGTYNVLADDAIAIVPANETVPLHTEENGRSAEAIVFPSNDYSGMAFSFKVAGHDKPYIWNLSESTEATNFEEGKEYIYNIVINKTEINVTATIKSWESGNGDGENGSAE